jgi:hypothetical protein
MTLDVFFTHPGRPVDLSALALFDELESAIEMWELRNGCEFSGGIGLIPEERERGTKIAAEVHRRLSENDLPTGHIPMATTILADFMASSFPVTHGIG